MHQWSENTWTIDQGFRLLGLELGARMTVCRWPDSSLCLYSPIQPTDEIRAQLEELGSVKWVIAPNLFHHLYVGHYRDLYPGAKFIGPSGLLKKRPDLRLDSHFDQETVGWPHGGPEIFKIDGISSHEVVLIFEGSLVVADLVFHIQQANSLWEKIFWIATGNYKKVAPTRFFKTLIRDESALQKSLDHLLKKPFDRILLCHGKVIESEAKSHLREAFEWILS